MSVLITGSSGFIGQHLYRALQDVVGVDIVDCMGHYNVYKCDITKPELLMGWDTFGRFDAIVHLAAIAAPAQAAKLPDHAWNTNVYGTYNVLKLAQLLNIRKVIFFSSAHVYGISPKYMPTDEEHPLSMMDTYTSTKVMGEKLCELFYKNHGISYTILRLFNAYGPGQSEDYFIGKKLMEAKEGRIHRWNGQVTKDWIHISDVVSATLAALKTEYVGPLNIGTGREISLEFIIRLIANGTWKDDRGEIIDDPDDGTGPTRMCCDNRRAKSVLKWEPKIKFEDGLKELMK